MPPTNWLILHMPHDKRIRGIPPLPQPGWWQRILQRWHARYENPESQREAVPRPSPKARFDLLLGAAADIAEENPRALADLVRSILRPLQSEYLLGVAERGRDPYQALTGTEFFGDAVSAHLWKSDWLRDRRIDSQSFTMSLARDMILPCAWSSSRYIEAMVGIGEAKHDDEDSSWRQDANHRVELWLPWGIGFVHGGNHSITAGILAGDGSLQPNAVYDMSFLFDAIRCNGTHYLDAKTNQALSPVADIRRAAVFEIGRLMVQTECPAFARQLANATTAREPS